MANLNKVNSRPGFTWPVIIDNPNPRASLDYYYGPYESLSDLDDETIFPKELKQTGFTVAVFEDVNGKNTLVEYWYTESGWERKGVPTETNVNFKGIVDTLPTSAKVGDMYILRDADGDNTEYVWTSDGKFEMLGKLSSETTGALSLNGASFSIDGTSKTTKSFNGTQNVTLDMTKYLTTADAEAKYQPKGSYLPAASFDPGVKEIVSGIFGNNIEAIKGLIRRVKNLESMMANVCILNGENLEVYTNVNGGTHDTEVDIREGVITAKEFYEE